jgi:hypothetical protein
MIDPADMTLERKHALDLTTGEWVTVVWRFWLANLLIALVAGFFGGLIGLLFSVIAEMS